MFILPVPVILLLLVVLALISFFFSASETAVIGLSKIRLRHLIDKGIRGACSVQRLVAKFDKFIAAILIGSNFMNIAISAIVTAVFVKLFGYHWGVIISTFTSTFFVLILCDITPKIFAIKHPEKVALFTSPLMEFFIKIFRPVIYVFTGISNFILKMSGMTPAKRSPLITEEELRTMIEIGKEEGVLTDEERRLLYRIFEFGDTKVKDVMATTDKIIAINIKESAEKLIDIFVEEGHARIPVYEGSVENIIGIIYARDLLYLLDRNKLFVLEDLVHPAYYVPMEKRVNELLREFQQKKIQIAIVVDGNKKTVGLVTLEDLIEEIVGEIEEDVSNKIEGVTVDK